MRWTTRLESRNTSVSILQPPLKPYADLNIDLKGAALKIAVAQKKKEDAKMKQKENAASKLSSKGDIQLPDVKPVYPSEIKYLDTSR